MPSRLPVGPYRQVHLHDGSQCPFYIIPFDKNGVCIGPQTKQHLIESIRQGAFTDIFLFSHGWNNDWTVATDRYEHFLSGYMNMRQEHGLPVSADYRPLLVGIFWPSTALVFTEAEKGPAIAAGDPDVFDEAVSEQLDELNALAEELTPEQSARLYELAQKDSLSEDESLDLAEIIKTFYNKKDDELSIDDPVTAQDLVEIWAAASPEPDELDDFGTVGGVLNPDLQAAGLVGNLMKKLDPRLIIRTATVYQMKDRAGRVGFHGVGPLLTELLSAGDARIHLIGHSYGGKIVLSAASFGEALPRNVHSILLLQPAVSHLCFASEVPKSGKPGGYRPVLERVINPILSTFSKHDFPLTKTFHLALRRKDDLGEARIAAPGEPPSKYAALGGFGPRRCGEKLVEIHDVNVPYQLDPNTKIFGLKGDRTISGHGDISNPSTWWALYSLATA
jgi:hypothetical protein